MDSRNIESLKEFFKKNKGLTDGQLAILADRSARTISMWKRKCGIIKDGYQKPPRKAKGTLPDDWDTKERFTELYDKMGINAIGLLLNKDTWKEDIVAGFNECWRVLEDNGVMIFKWNNANKKASELIKAFPVRPLFGDFTGKTGATIWMTFIKLRSDGC